MGTKARPRHSGASDPAGVQRAGERKSIGASMLGFFGFRHLTGGAVSYTCARKRRCEGRSACKGQTSFAEGVYSDE